MKYKNIKEIYKEITNNHRLIQINIKKLNIE